MRSSKRASAPASINRFSTRVGAEMGRKIGAYVAANVLQPVDVAGAEPAVGPNQEKSISPVRLDQR